MGKSHLEQLAKEVLLPREDHKPGKNQSCLAVTKEGEHHTVMDKQQWLLRDVQNDPATLVKPGKVPESSSVLFWTEQSDDFKTWPLRKHESNYCNAGLDKKTIKCLKD